MSIDERKRITVTYTKEEYESLKLLSSKNKISLSEQVREFTLQGLNGEVTKNNVDFLAPIIREQLTSTLVPYLNKLTKLTSKTFIQSATASLLGAETINRFVPFEKQDDVFNTYTDAKKKAVSMLKVEDDII